MKFEIDEPQFTQREVLGVIDLPATSLNTWLKQGRGKGGNALLEPFEFVRDFRVDDERFQDLIEGKDSWDKVRRFKVFNHDPAIRRIRLYSVLDALCLAGIKAVLDANIEIRFASQFPGLLCDLWTDVQLINLNRLSVFETPIVLYVDEGRLLALYPQPTERVDSGALLTGRDHKVIDPKLNQTDLLTKMRNAQLTTVTVIDWPSIEDRTIDGLKRIIGERGHRDWDES